MLRKCVVRRLPMSSQNPLLGLRPFHKHCERRFISFPFERGFQQVLSEWRELRLLLPIFWDTEETALFSTFQLWQVYQLYGSDPIAINPENVRLLGFEKLLRLLLKIQDYYLPEVRGNLRTGIYRNYSRERWSATVLLSSIRYWREDLIRRHLFVPRKTLDACELDGEALLDWIG